MAKFDAAAKRSFLNERSGDAAEGDRNDIDEALERPVSSVHRVRPWGKRREGEWRPADSRNPKHPREEGDADLTPDSSELEGTG